MGRKLSISKPTVVTTDLVPLTDKFNIEPNGLTEQWYFANTGEYSPDRETTPLTLIPKLTAIDTETDTVYTPSFYTIAWYKLAADGTWTLISNHDSSTPGDYYSGNNLIVRTNVAPAGAAATGGVTYKCTVQYIDPRDASITSKVEADITLTTNLDSKIDLPTVEIQTAGVVSFDVLTDNTSVRTFTAKAFLHGEDVSSDYYFEWYALESGEQSASLIGNHLCYKECTQETGKGQGTDTISIDMMFTDSVDIICRLRTSSSGTLYPSVSQVSAVWSPAQIEAITHCDEGQGTSDGTVRDMTFSNIVNTKLGTLSDSVVAQHLRTNWKIGFPAGNGDYSDNDEGWGAVMTRSSSYMYQLTTRSTPVHAELYLLGAYAQVVDGNGNQVVNGSNVPVVGRTV